MTRPRQPTVWSTASRTVAGTLGAYGLTYLATAALSLLLPHFGLDRVEAVYSSLIASFLIFAEIAILVFSAKTAGRAWKGLLIAAVPLALATLLLLPR